MSRRFVDNVTLSDAAATVSRCLDTGGIYHLDTTRMILGADYFLAEFNYCPATLCALVM